MTEYQAQMLKALLERLNRMDIRDIKYIHFNPPAALEVNYIDNGGNFHSVGYTSKGRMVTYE